MLPLFRVCLSCVETSGSLRHASVHSGRLSARRNGAKTKTSQNSSGRLPVSHEVATVGGILFTLSLLLLPDLAYLGPISLFLDSTPHAAT